MGYIKLYKANFNSAPSTGQTVRIEYRLASSTGVFTLFSNSYPVLATGFFSPEVVIPSLVDGETYTIKVTSLCGGGVLTQNITAGASCTSYTVTGSLGGATVQWYDCSSGAPMSKFLNEGEQFTFALAHKMGTVHCMAR